MVVGAPGPSGLLGQGLENRAGTRAGRMKGGARGFGKGSQPKAQEARPEAPAFWATALLSESFHGSYWGGRDMGWEGPDP